MLEGDLWQNSLLLAVEGVVWLAGSIVLAWIFYLLFLGAGNAQKRQERALCFLQLLETGIKQGRSVEETIISLSQSRAQALGVHFHLLAAYIEERGHRLSEALKAVPNFLPAKTTAMLKVGEEIGAIEKVLPVCRQTLTDGVSKTQASLNNIAAVLFVTPASGAVVWILTIWVFPKLQIIATEFLQSVPLVMRLAIEVAPTFAVVVLVFWFLCYAAMSLRSTGPRFVNWLEAGLWPVSHWIAFRLPWRHKRMQRDISAMLSLLLDAEVPETVAVRLAAQSTANLVFIERAERVVHELGQGVELTKAIQLLDDSGEFSWRLRNAVQPLGSFSTALAGWHDSLEAKAFQQEQTVSQIVTTGFVLLNGLMVGIVALGVFGILIAIVQGVTLW
jgi:type II secretory pathway component PulF